MSTDRQPREGEEPRPREGQEPGQQAGQDGAKPPQDAKKPYVFKFRPADPKNDLEFEDMADK